jgi:hypothetical protein
LIGSLTGGGTRRRPLKTADDDGIAFHDSVSDMKIAMVPSARLGRHWIEVLAVVSLSASAGAASSPTAERFTAGGGDGRMSVGARIKVHKGSDQIEHEDYAAGTVLLKDVKVS